MSSLYTYGTGSNYQSTRFSTVQELLNGILDNNANLIFAEDVRDAVFTLWEKVSEVEIIAASAASASSVDMFFQNSEPTLQDLGGIPEGTSFSTPQTLQEMFTALLYPYTPPVGSISITNGFNRREYGSTTTIGLDWTATKKSKPITSISVAGENFSVTNGNTQTGTKNALGTYSIPPPVSVTNTFSITVGDEDNTTTSSVSLQYMNKIYWGTIDLSSIGNPDLTLNPGSASLINITRTIILGLTGAGVGLGNELSITKNKTYPAMNGNGRYLIFAWPSSVPGATNPTFTIGANPISAFTRVKTAWSFSNQFFVATNYEVWVSNTAYNSAISSLIIS
jgi:hypothetical protein